MGNELDRFSDLICASTEDEIKADVTLGGRLILKRAGDLVVSYAPVDYVQNDARVVLVGITPGAFQARNALIAYRRTIIEGADRKLALAAAKRLAAFSGAMRSNLIGMLDCIGINRWLGMATTAALWTTHTHLVHFTSALRYPVFLKQANYNGHPSMETSAPLRALLDVCLHEEVRALPDAIWIPLGSKAAVGLMYLVEQGALDPSRLLCGLPHPSGANSERVKYFLGKKSLASLSVMTNGSSLDLIKARLIDLVNSIPTERLKAQT